MSIYLEEVVQIFEAPISHQLAAPLLLSLTSLLQATHKIERRRLLVVQSIVVVIMETNHASCRVSDRCLYLYHCVEHAASWSGWRAGLHFHSACRSVWLASIASAPPPSWGGCFLFAAAMCCE